MKQNVKLGAVIIELGMALILFIVGVISLMAIPVGDLPLDTWAIYFVGSKVLAVVCIAVSVILHRMAAKTYDGIEC